MTTITRGNLKPDLVVVIGDDANDVDFSVLTTSSCRIVGEIDGVVVVDGQPTTITASPDNKELTLNRAWGNGETDTPGRMWITVHVTWPDGDTQDFPEDEPLRLNIRRAPGDA